MPRAEEMRQEDDHEQRLRGVEFLSGAGDAIMPMCEVQGLVELPEATSSFPLNWTDIDSRHQYDHVSVLDRVFEINTSVPSSQSIGIRKIGFYKAIWVFTWNPPSGKVRTSILPGDFSSGITDFAAYHDTFHDSAWTPETPQSGRSPWVVAYLRKFEEEETSWPVLEGGQVDTDMEVGSFFSIVRLAVNPGDVASGNAFVIP
jgi:hypothetical protein